MSNKENIRTKIEKVFSLKCENYVFIYTSPKVGSTTLVSSLRISLNNNYNIIHIHDDIMLSVLTGINDITVNEIINYLSEQGKNVYVIDVYRSPIERKMSEFFEKISPYHFNNTEENINKYNIKRIVDRFNKLFPHLAKGDHYFDKYGIEESKISNFDYNKKYSIQIINNIKYIKLRLFDSALWKQILSEIFNSDIVIIKDYQTDNKAIGDLYKRFKDEYKLPRNYYELIKNCKYFNFYLNEEERIQYLKVWENKLVDNFVSYTESEYAFYVKLYLENQYINDIQTEHYIDDGCLCELCTKKRKAIYIKAKNGETKFKKILHNDVVNEVIQNRNKMKNKYGDLISNSKKYKVNQFSLKL